MEINKKMYKYTSIISLAIIVMLLANIIVPALTIADTVESTESDTPGIVMSKITATEDKKQLYVTGVIDSKYSEYSIYWAKGPVVLPADANKEDKAQYMDYVVRWFSDSKNSIVTDIGKDIVAEEGQQYVEFDSRIPISDATEKNATYNFLCVATDETNYEWSYVTLVLNVDDQGTEGDEEGQGQGTEGNEGDQGQGQGTEGNEGDQGQGQGTEGNEGDQSQGQETEGNEGDQGQGQGTEGSEGNQGQGQGTEGNQDDEDIVVQVDPKNKNDEYVEIDGDDGNKKPSVQPTSEPTEPIVEPVSEPKKNSEIDDNKENEKDLELESQQSEGEVISNKTDEDIPQTGSNDTGIIVAIIIFSIISMGSFVKYRTTNE